MNRILYHKRCRCPKNRRFNIISEGRPLKYPYPDPEDPELNTVKVNFKTFHLKYKKKLSLTEKFILNSFRNKYTYYAIDDILYLLKAYPIERDNILNMLYSPILFLHNNFSINFFDIWITEIYINERLKDNKFIINDSQNLEKFTYITIKFLYKDPIPIKIEETLC